MNWTAYVDSYCERLAPGLWGEPLNTVSNVSFLVAALALWWQARRSAQPVLARVLAGLIGLIFLASTALHSLATRWSGAADSGGILLFVLFYVVAFCHVLGGVRWSLAWLAAPAFLLFTVALTAAGAALGFGGSSYIPPLLGIFGIAIWLATRPDPELRRQAPRFALIGGIFGLSLSLRTVDHTVCGSFPPGTHFLWHLLNGLVLYLVARVVTTDRPVTTRPTGM